VSIFNVEVVSAGGGDVTTYCGIKNSGYFMNCPFMKERMAVLEE
jgi:hypothetical protein